MPRSGRLRRYIREFTGSSRAEKISFIPPFLIIIVEGVLLAHALTINVPDIMVVELTTILLIISLVEILFVSREMHEHYMSSSFDRILTIRLDDFVLQQKEKNVKKIVEDFIDMHSHYKNHRNEIYHITCQIMETHKEEAREEALMGKLKPFIKRRKKKNVDQIIKAFIKKYPQYKKYRAEVYEQTCQLMVNSKNK